MEGRYAFIASPGEEAMSLIALYSRQRHRKEYFKVIEHSLGDFDSFIGRVKAEVTFVRDVAGVVIVQDVVAPDGPRVPLYREPLEVVA
jgi:hypothetical protein